MSFPVTTRGPQTAADWTAANPILDQFEVGIEINPATGAYERAKLGDGRTAWADLAYWNPSGGPKVYRALLEAGDPPTVTVVESTLNESPTWAKDAAGRYFTTFNEVPPFTANKTFVMATFATSSVPGTNVPAYITAFRVSDSIVQIETYCIDTDAVWTLGDWAGQVAIQILVSP